MVRRSGSLAPSLVALGLLAACAVRPPSLGRPSPVSAATRGAAAAPDPRIVGITISGGERLTFDPVPNARVSRDSIYARVSGDPYVIPRAGIGQFWMARPGEEPYAVSASDARADSLWRAASLDAAAVPATPGPASGLPLAPGMWVRVDTLADRRFAGGRLVRVAGDTVVVADGGHERSLLVGGRRRLWVASGTRAHPAAGAAVGAPIGALVGVLTYSPSAPPDCTGDPFCVRKLGHEYADLFGRMAQGALGGLVGAGIGALIGSAIHTTVWVPVSRDQLDRLQVGIVPLPGGRAGLRLSLRI